MNTFIGKGPDFLSDHLQLPPSCKDSDWIIFETTNSDLLYFRSAHLYSEQAIFFIIYKDREIMGLLKTQKSIFNSDSHPFQGINYVSVKEKYQGQGLARQLYEAMFNYFSKGYVVGTDYETNDSQLKLEKMSYRLAKEYNVFFLTRQAMLKYEGAKMPKDIYSLYLLAEYSE